MTTKQITDLSAATTIDDGDLFIIRKTASGLDQKVAKADLVKGLGNAAVNGFTATSDASNKVILASSNSTIVDTYYNGMRVTFVSPIASDGVVQIKIGALAYKDLIQHGTTDSTILIVDKYIEAVYIGDSSTGKFYQTNLVTPSIYSSEYTATGIIAEDELSTTLTVTSAIGIAKSSYYVGMVLFFTCPIATKGLIRVDVDGLGNKDINDGDDDKLPANFFASQAIKATYNGTNFTRSKYATRDEKKLTSSTIITPPVTSAPNQDPYDPDYLGNPDDPAFAETVDSVDSMGNRFFDSEIITVGSGGKYASLPEAIAAMIHDYGDDPAINGRNAYSEKRHAILIKSSYDQTKFLSNIIGGNDLSWISIFSEDTVTYNPGGNAGPAILCYAKKMPIFNFKLRSTGARHSNILFYTVYTGVVRMTFGRKAEIHIETTGTGEGSNPPLNGIFCSTGMGEENGFNVNIPYGIKIYSPDTLFAPIVDSFFKLSMNHGTWIHTGTNGFLLQGYSHLHVQYELNIYNTVVTFPTKNTNSSYGFCHIIDSQKTGSTYMQNVTCTDRTNTMIGIKSRNQNVTLNNCKFAATTASDLIVAGDSEYNRIILQNGTTGSTNQAKNIKTNLGVIIE